MPKLMQELSGIPPLFDGLIFMVIDGLPAEFVLGKDGQPPQKDFIEAMPYTQSLLAEGMALGYHAKASPPTVTMPRLKAMVSGAIGGFLDVAFNFNTQAFLDDNLIEQFFRVGCKMVMHGDETWLKMFPGLFTRHDAVSSFFVKDTIQVDHNVSRHLTDELCRTDWNLLILHYLGLDHVGHIGGRSSVLMAPKLKEMDEVIRKIHLSVTQTQENDQRRTLLMVISDHGMTENGNHGGSSYEETDSLALFVGPKNYRFASATCSTIQQVDIASTLALLFGVPIPKNNVGVLIAETFNSLTEDLQLRALELNSWQLLRLLEAQLPDLSCESFSGNIHWDDHGFETRKCSGTVTDVCCCLYLKAAALHKLWKSKIVSRSNRSNDHSSIILAYNDFLQSASGWLSHRAMDKPIGLLGSGVAAMLLSCFTFVFLLSQLCQEIHLRQKSYIPDINNNMQKCHLDETVALAIILILVLSMGSSSLVEEEQYVWHFVTSTFYLILLYQTMRSTGSSTSRSSHCVMQEKENRNYIQILFLILILSSGRILRGWHQGGVNWTHLPDIAKWLEQAGSAIVKSVQLISGCLLISLGLYALSLLQLKRKFAILVGFVFLLPGGLVLQHIYEYQGSALAASSYAATLKAQLILVSLGTITAGAVIALPWLTPFWDPKSLRYNIFLPNDVTPESKSMILHVRLRESTFMTAWAYVFCWCLLQLLLQQPINAPPILLLLIQILASLLYFYTSDLHCKPWVEVAALYYLGMAGHFCLGNTNTLATIDVAGAFIGVSSYSTIFSGFLMFVITYASPVLALLAMMMHGSVKDTGSLLNPEDVDSGISLMITIGFPCLVPLALNSVLLVAYTTVLLLMRNHLFVWSVFSPKYLYVCTTTVCVYIGVSIIASTGFYTCLILGFRRRLWGLTQK